MVTRKMLKLCYFNTSSVVKPAISTFCCLESSSFTWIISPHRPCCVGLFPEYWHLQHLKLEKEFCLIIASNFFCCRVMYSLYRSQPCVLRAPISCAMWPCCYRYHRSCPGKPGCITAIQWHCQKPHSFLLLNTPFRIFFSNIQKYEQFTYYLLNNIQRNLQNFSFGIKRTAHGSL